ncbi:hypothetical protein [Bacillus cereus]|uniref:hypothetical protein n=1 Tax=Bacillus cereus TaxID=1396 RepID=UPI001D0D6D26|nr:hypothetical protein [Bacillus cereus]
MKRKIGLVTDEVKCLTERTKVRSSELRRPGMTELEYAKTVLATILVVNSNSYWSVLVRYGALPYIRW